MWLCTLPVTDIFPCPSPSFVVVTGDLTDAKDARRITSQQYLEEWQVYRKAIDERAGDILWYDMRGNHDCFDLPSWQSHVNLYRSYGQQQCFIVVLILLSAALTIVHLCRPQRRSCGKRAWCIHLAARSGRWAISIRCHWRMVKTKAMEKKRRSLQHVNVMLPLVLNEVLRDRLISLATWLQEQWID